VEKDRVRKALKGLSIAGLATSVVLLTAGCKTGEKKSSCSSGGSEKTSEKSSCGKGSCGKGSCGSGTK